VDTLTRLSKAKTSLILGHPFVGTVAMSMPMVIDASVPTAATNGSEVRFNPDFVDSLDDDEVTFLVAHECFHPMLEHNFRRLGRDASTWNKAADYVINQLLHDEGIGRFIEGGLLDRSVYDAGGGSADGVYAVIDKQDDDTSDRIGGIGPDLEDAGGTAAEVAQAAAENRVMVAQAAQAARMQGKLSAGLSKLVEEILQPKVNWADVLHQFVEKQRTDERTFARPNRRFLAQGLYLPSVSGETLEELVFFIDCSGSVTQSELDQYAAEVSAVHEQSKPKLLHVIYFDTDICHHDTFEADDQIEINMHGGGGTRFSQLWEYVSDNSIDPAAAIVLTDLCCLQDYFGEAPEYPVLWVSTDRSSAPFGRVILVK